MKIPFVFEAAVMGIILFNACNNEDLTQANAGKIDSLNRDSIPKELVLKESEIKTANEDWIHLNKGEWYCRANFIDYDRNRGILIFEQEDGNPREISSNPWGRNGEMILGADRSIRLEKDKPYELIYYYQYENPAEKNNKASGFYLSDIVPRSFYFNTIDRYTEQNKSVLYKFEAKSKGVFFDDLNGGAIHVLGDLKNPELFYSNSPSSDKSKISYASFLPKALKVDFPEASTDAFLNYIDGNWIYKDLNGKRRVFRPEKLQ